MKRLTLLTSLIMIFGLTVSQYAVAQGRGSASVQIYQDMINRNEADRQARLAREAAAAEAQRQRNYEAQQAAERRRQQTIRNASLPNDSRCLSGAWLVKRTGSSTVSGATLDIANDGKVYFMGDLINGNQGASLLLANNTVDITIRFNNGESLRQRLSLSNNQLIGTVTLMAIKEGFWGDKKLPPETFDVRGERTNQAPEGCISSVRNSADSTASVRGETIADGLKNLSDLYDQGILTEEEFNAAKRRLLGL